MDHLADLLKKLKKTLDKENVQSVGFAMHQKVAEEKKAMDKTQKKVTEEAKKIFSTSRGSLENSLKGQFAKKVSKAIENQEKGLEIR